LAQAQAAQQVPQVGQVVNGYQWNGTQWVAPVQQAPQVGQVVNGHRWDGTQWVPLAQAQAAQQVPQVGQVVNGYLWNGSQWVPADQQAQAAQQAPAVGQVVNGHQWDGTRWVPLGQQAPAVGQVVNGHQWDGTQWVPLAGGAADQQLQPGQAERAEPSALFIQLKGLAESQQFTVSQKGNVVTASKVIAERTAFMSTAKLEYLAKITIDDRTWEVKFSELLKETGTGLSGGEDSDGMVGAGFGFQSGTYHSGGGLEDDIADQASRYGKLYTIAFDYAAWREQAKNLVEAAGYQFKYGNK
jgi:hypothetical protein